MTGKLALISTFGNLRTNIFLSLLGILDLDNAFRRLSQVHNDRAEMLAPIADDFSPSRSSRVSKVSSLLLLKAGVDKHMKSSK